ncbi:MAG TPA: DUF1206 domain-containing protein [Thermoanaerobaculia bacterium]|nr:DUF1206 domain-containing protein [Thermoanaerobaculia bacterium]
MSVVQEARREAAPWIERLARLGYISVGTVYVIIGFFAASAPFGRGKTGDQKDAFAFILHAPFGRLLLWVMALGLGGYAIWRFASAWADSEHRGNGAKGLALRAGSVGRGALYAWFAVELVRFAMRNATSGAHSEAKAKHWTGRLMDAPFGRWLVAAAGLGVAAYGIYQLYAAVTAKLSKQLHLSGARSRTALIAISRFGLGARGLVFLVIGASLVIAAWHHNPNEAHGTSGALQALEQPFGGALLVLTGIGIVAYGAYAYINAWYRRVAVE